MLNYFKMRFCFYNARFYIATTFIFFTFQYSTLNNEICTFLLTFFNRLQIHGNCIFINEWTDMVMFIQRITDPELPVSSNQFVPEFFIDLFMYDQPAGGGAPLACRTYSAKNT